MTFWSKLFPAKQRLRRFTGSLMQLEERRLLSGTPIIITDGAFNDSRTDATSLGTTTTLRPGNWQVNGNIGIGTDRVDFYSFQLHDRAAVSITLTNLRANMQIELFRSNGEPLTKSNNKALASESISTTVGAGLYYIKVSSGGSNTLASSYRLNVTTTLALLPDADENNNTLALAKNLGTVSALNPTISDTRTNRNIGFSGDTNDYYKFTVSNLTRASGTVSISGLSFNANLQILNATGGLVSQSVLTGTSTDSVTLTNLNPGTYYIRVYPGETGAATAYNLNVNITANTDTDFGGSNNSNTDAINLGTAGTSPLIKSTSDSIGTTDDTEDVFKFTVASGRKAKFNLELTILKGLPANLTLELVDAAGNVIPLSQTVKGNQKIVTLGSAADRLSAGTYFIRFSAAAGTNIDYRFLLNAQTQLG